MRKDVFFAGSLLVSSGLGSLSPSISNAQARERSIPQAITASAPERRLGVGGCGITYQPPVARITAQDVGINWAPVYKSDLVGKDSFHICIYDNFYSATYYGKSAPFGKPGVSWVYGHNDWKGAVFARIRYLENGDIIDVYHGENGKLIDEKYTVAGVHIVPPTDMEYEWKRYKNPTLVLTTCDYKTNDQDKVEVVAQEALPKK